MVLNSRIRSRFDLKETWSTENPVLSSGEIGIEKNATTGELKVKVGDGNKSWNNLPYIFNLDVLLNTINQRLDSIEEDLVAKQDILLFDNEPIANSGRLLTSGTIKTAIDAVMAVAEGKTKTYIFADQAAVNAFVADTTNQALLKTGDILLTTKVDDKDYWWDGTTNTIYELEARNMDLSTYALKTELPTTLPANGGNADTIDGYHIVKATAAPTNAASNIITIVV